MARTDFAYAQARLQARLGRQPDEVAWRTLEASRGAAHYLTLARAGALSPWVEGLADAVEVGRVERHLRSRWQRHVDEVARWLPAAWRPAVEVFGRLPEVGLLPDDDAPAPAGGPSADGLSGTEAAARWRDAWRTALPAGAPPAIDRPAELLLPRLAGHGAGRPAHPGAVQHALRRLLRRQAATPVAVFAYLALAALDLERLRGGLVARRLLVLPEAA